MSEQTPHPDDETSAAPLRPESSPAHECTPAGPRVKVSPGSALVAVGFVLALLATTLLLGGWLHLWWGEAEESVAADAGPRQLVGILAAISAFLTLLCGGVSLLRRDERKGIAFATILAALVCGVSLLAVEIAGRTQLPPWPARDLRGVDPALSRQWIGMDQDDPARQWNSWGQPDAERALRPAEGTFRIAMIGDSFLDESIGTPLPLVAQQLLGRDDIEVLNLGVSATAPDEYYYRLKNVALPLHIDACVICLYTGNDLSAPARTLRSYGGIAAVTPRGSFLSDVGLSGTNFLFTHRRRPVLAAWTSAGGLGAAEQQLHEQFRQRDDAGAAELLLQQTPIHFMQYADMLQRLNRPEMKPFYEMLRHPDGGRFRSYFLPEAVWSAATGRIPPDDDLNVESTLHWTLQMQRLCEGAGVEMIVAVIPEGFQVDPRMQELWSPLADMRRITNARRQAAATLIETLRSSGVDVLDLFEGLKDIRGTYLNLDGHWSQLGTEQAAREIAGHLRGTVLAKDNADGPADENAATQQTP